MASKRFKIVAGVSSVALLAAGVIGYKLTHKGPPSFRKGGQFAVAGPPTDPTITSSTPAPTETSATTIAPAQPGTTAPGATSSTTATTARKPGAASSSTVTTARGATTTTRAASGPAPTPTPTGAKEPVPPPSAPAVPGKPAVGTYTYTVDGTEGASFVGTRKYPQTMTMVVHAGGGVKSDQLVFDITYSNQHAEREIVGFRNDGVYFDFEGGSITFGPRTETSQADYDPPMTSPPA